nr:translocation/assembly module TamB domain-containing protein [Gammaproteobacteria bacterium]
HSSFGNVKLDADGEWNGMTWLGSIDQLVMTHPQLQQWQLLKPVNLTLTPEQDTVNINFPRSCLIQKQARLCAAAHGSMDHQLDATLLLDSLPLALTKAWLPDEMALIGTLSANAELISRNKNLSADLKATIDDASFLLTDDDQVNHQISFRTDKLQIQYHGDQLKSQVELDVGGHDSIQAEITAGEGNATGVRQLSGKLNARIKDMRFIDGLVADIRQLQGQLIADLEIGGTSGQPILNGTAKWQNGQLEITRLGSTFTDINVLVNNDVKDQQRLNLTTEIKSGEGQLSAHGYLDLDAAHQFPLQFKLNGENFQISRLPEAEVEISPNLTLNKHDDLIDITGLIKIDSAKIEIKTLPESAIQPSEDEVIITSNQPEPKKAKASQLNTNIAIDFGGSTHFSGFGLKTRMAGKLDYVTKKDKQRMQGRAEMRDATYRSYGQDLTIRKGEFLFNGPTDNPWLNIEAIRKATNDNVTAILGVSGPLKSPKTRIFSEPSLPESEALAYLVTGKSLKNASKSEGSTVANAALNYGVGELSWLSDQLGIDEFEFEQSEKIADSAIRLGQYLNPDLYVGVSVGLFASKYAVNIRYRLSEHFNLSTRAGDTQRIELQYHIQAD